MKKTIIISGISSLVIVSGIVMGFSGSDSEIVNKKPAETYTKVKQNKNEPIYHLNNAYVFDLSNRTSKEKQRAVNDSEIVDYFIGEIDDKFKDAYNRKSLIHKDIHRIQTTSREMYGQLDINADNLSCDLSRYERPIDLSNFLFNRNTNGENMNEWKSRCSEEFQSLYSKAKKQSRGADIFNYVKDCKRHFGRKLRDSKFKKNIRENKYKENLFIITDGYIEYGQNSNEKKAPYLSSNRIKAFKTSYLKNGNGRSIEEFFEDEKYGITPVFDKSHENINIMLIGFEDRSVDEFGIAKKGVKIKDRIVLELFWKDWLAKSGFKHIEISPVLTSKTELDELVMKFINN